jgi:p-aminobenzoyl-glutamate transporter AbgT
MAQLTMAGFTPAAVVGILSAAANVVEKQAKDKGNGNVFFNNASLWGDIAIGGYAVANYMSPQGWYPRGGGLASTAMAGAGIALLARRATDWIGAVFLKLPTGVNRMQAIPGRSMMRGRPSLRSPGAAVETGILPRKRQFFSVT